MERSALVLSALALVMFAQGCAVETVVHTRPEAEANEIVRLLERSGIDRHVEAVLVSDEVGADKPDAAMFDAAFAAMGDPDRARTVMVGDSLASDIAGGNAYGLRTVWIRGGDYGNDPDQQVSPTLTVDRLAELVA